MSKATTTTTATTRTIPPSLSHFVIFNPTVKLDESVKSHQNVTEGSTTTIQPREAAADRQTPDSEHTPSSPPTEARDRDLEDDLREAAQILFYTSRSSRNISRNTMLKQTGLIRGLMGFSDMLVPSSSSENFISIKSSKSRLIVYKPEPDFFIGVDITLAHTQAEDGTKEAVVTSQGLSDALIRGALDRGYADFRLLFGELNTHLPPTPATLSLLERYWTRFAFAFENDTLHPSPSLDIVLPHNRTPMGNISQAVQRALEVFIEDSELQNLDYGIISPGGPLHATIGDPALSRFLVSLVSAALPPVLEPKSDGRHTLGIGRTARLEKESRDRKISWGMGWVPTLPGLTPRSITPVAGAGEPNDRPRTSGTSAVGGSVPEKEETKGRWGFGMPHLGLGEAMGTVGGVFGLGSTKTTSTAANPPPTTTNPAVKETSTDSPRTSVSSLPRRASLDAARSSRATEPPTQSPIGSVIVDQLDRMSIPDNASHVSSTAIDVDDLQAAVEVEEIDLGWEKRNVHVLEESGEAQHWRKRRLTWVIRENTLLFLLYPHDAEAPYTLPSSQTTLSLYSKLSGILSPERAGQSTRATAANTTVVVSPDSTEKTGAEMDMQTSASLAELHDILHGLGASVPQTHRQAARAVQPAEADHSDMVPVEIYARTPAGKVIVARRKEEKDEELYMVVGRKDASLTDAEYAIRALAAGPRPRKRV